MPVWRLTGDVVFPDPTLAEPDGLIALGGDLSPDRLIAAYSQGIFPWYAEGPILWFSPDPRMILLPTRLRLSRSLRRSISKGMFEIRCDTAFRRVIEACAAVERRGQAGTWVNAEMIEAYTALHALGYAHSVEAWDGQELVGGLYGVSLGAAFFGESMFALRDDASKVALAHLARQLDAWDFRFIDCQIESEHLARLGATPWRRARFLAELSGALRVPTRQGRWELALETS